MSPPWKGDVLTAWPRGHIRISRKIFNLVSYPRLERGTTWLKVKCSTTWANSPSTSIRKRNNTILQYIFNFVNTFFEFYWKYFENLCKILQIILKNVKIYSLWSGIEVVITRLSRKQLVANRDPWVRIPLTPPIHIKKDLRQTMKSLS